MPVCITGMHRSGTSLVTNLLRLCGLYLGKEADLLPATVDNEAGYWESRSIMLLNDEILRQLGGAWDSPPPLGVSWAHESRFQSLRQRAEALLREFAGREPWGWKDPRCCLTLPFWQDLDGIKLPFRLGRGPKLRVVLCLRDPLEVFESLRDRRFTPSSSGLDLWLTYNRSILNSTRVEDRIITHYDAYFRNAAAELRRVLNFLEIAAPDDLVERSIAAVSRELRHKNSSGTPKNPNLTAEMMNLYNAMCEEAAAPVRLPSSRRSYFLSSGGT